MEKSLSVIVPCYNAGRYLDDAVNSILTQKTDVPYEIVIINDGSTDPLTKEVLERYRKSPNPIIRVLDHEVNKGLPAARNTGISASRYPYILPLDADDRLTPEVRLKGEGYITKGVGLLHRNPGIDAIQPQAYFFGHVEGKVRFPVMNERRMLFKNHIPQFCMYRKSLWEETGGYNEKMKYGEDWCFWVSIINLKSNQGRAASFLRVDEPLVEFRTHGDGKNLSASFRAVSPGVHKQLIEHNPEIFRKHFPDIPDFALPYFLAAGKLAYVGKLALKSAFSQNARTFMSSKAAVAKAMLSPSAE